MSTGVFSEEAKVKLHDLATGEQLTKEETVTAIEESTSTAVSVEKVEAEKDAVEQLKQGSLPQHLTARSLTLVSECGKSRITLRPYPDIAGLWIEASPDGDKYPRSCIAIYDDKQQGPVIGFYRDVGEENLAMHFAISLGDSNQPTLQVDNGRGGYGSIGLHEILDKIKPDWR